MARGSAGAGPRTADLPVVKEWVLASEAAVLMGVSRQYIHQLIRADQLKAYQLSGYVALRRQQVLDWKVQRDASAEEAVRETATAAA